jgi:hypothetical protein
VGAMIAATETASEQDDLSPRQVDRFENKLTRLMYNNRKPQIYTIRTISHIHIVSVFLFLSIRCRCDPPCAD